MGASEIVRMLAQAKPQPVQINPNRAQRRQMGFYARPVRLGNTRTIDHTPPWQHPPVMVRSVRERALARVRKAA